MPPVRNNRGSNRNRGGGIDVVDISSSSSNNPRKSSPGGGSSAATAAAAISPAMAGWETNTCEFATAFPMETKDITWRVKDFTTMMQLKGADGKHLVKFNAGDSIDMASKWKLEIIGDDEKIGLFLSLVQYSGPASKVFARFDSSIKYPCGSKDLVSRSIQPTDMKAVEDWGWNSFTTLPQLKASKALGANDSVTIQIKFVLYGKKVVNTLAPACADAALERVAKDEVTYHLGDLLESGKNSDFVIKVPNLDNSSEYASVKVHKAILAARSPVFQAMLDSQMMESQSGELKIEDLSLKSLNVMLKFIYTGTVDEEWRKIPEEIVNAADKYSLPTLKDYCDKKLHTTCKPENALQLLKLAKIHQLATAITNIGTYIKSNVEGIVDNV